MKLSVGNIKNNRNNKNKYQSTSQNSRKFMECISLKKKH